MNKGQIRQGDVLLVPDGVSPPEGTSPQTEVVLAVGETTGHAHRVSGRVLDWNDTEGRRYVRAVGAPGVLTHEDHDPIPAPVVEPDTTYRVVIQQEWDLMQQWKQQWKQVTD